MTVPKIVRYQVELKTAVLELAIKAWAPVFEKTQNDVPAFVYKNFYPNGWEQRQLADIGELLDVETDNIWVAMDDGVLAGFVGVAIHPEDNMGEVSIIAVSPEFQQRGIGTALMEFAERQIRKAGMSMVMVETVGDSGHKPARLTYESLGYEIWPVARYFKTL